MSNSLSENENLHPRNEAQRIMESAGSGLCLRHPDFRSLQMEAQGAGLPCPFADEDEFIREREAELVRYVEEPCRALMRQIWAAGGSPYASNFHGNGPQGIHFTNKEGADSFLQWIPGPSASDVKPYSSRDGQWRQVSVNLSPEDREEKLRQLDAILPSLSVTHQDSTKADQFQPEGWYWGSKYGEFRGSEVYRGPFQTHKLAVDAVLVQTRLCIPGQVVNSSPPHLEHVTSNVVVSEDPIRLGIKFTRDRYEIVDLGGGRFGVFLVTSNEISSREAPTADVEAHDVAAALHGVAPSIDAALKIAQQNIGAYRDCVNEDIADRMDHQREEDARERYQPEMETSSAEIASLELDERRALELSAKKHFPALNSLIGELERSLASKIRLRKYKDQGAPDID